METRPLGKLGLMTDAELRDEFHAILERLDVDALAKLAAQTLDRDSAEAELSDTQRLLT